MYGSCRPGKNFKVNAVLHIKRYINFLEVATRQSSSVIKVSEQIRNDEFKWLGFSFTVCNNFSLKPLPMLKTVINKTLEYKVNLSLKFLICIRMLLCIS